VLKESKNNLVFINNAENDVKSLLEEIQKDVKLSRVAIVSAFFNYSGFVKEFLEKCIEDKIKIKLITGSSPIHLDPTEAKTLFHEYKKNENIFSLSRYNSTKKNLALHSKFYLFYKKGKSHPSYFLFGSSNMSESGFSRNYESNLFGTNTEILKILKKELKNIPTTSFDPSIYKEKPKDGLMTKSGFDEGRWSPFAYQQVIIDIIKKEFEKEDKGNVILPCGTGKTLISLWLKEQMKFEKVLVFLPSLALLNQTMTEWHTQKTDDYQTMCVCSDKSIKLSEDETGYSKEEYALLEESLRLEGENDRITTDPNTIKKFIDNHEKFVIFSTYHSSKEIKDACGENKKFDCIFYDESHNIATIKSKTSKESFTQSHHIASEKKLFMTATPKIVNPDLIDGITKEDYRIFSMDDETIFGPTFYDMSFREAIDNPDIPVLPFEILLAQSDEQSANTLDRKQGALMKTYNEKNEQKPRFDVNKVISYHSSIKNSKQFISNTTNFDKIRNKVLKKDLYAKHINGKDNANKIKKILDGLEDSDMGIVTNCRCLSEGVNAPSIDAVFFSDPKTNVIDIVQATGRAMRKDFKNPEKKKAYIIIPTDDETSMEQMVRTLQALALTDDHAESLIEEIVKAQKNNKSITLPDWIKTVPELPSRKMNKMLKALQIIVAKKYIPMKRGSIIGKSSNFFQKLTLNAVSSTSGPGELIIVKAHRSMFGDPYKWKEKSNGNPIKWFDIIFQMNDVNDAGKTIWYDEERLKAPGKASFDAKKDRGSFSQDLRFSLRNKYFYRNRNMEIGDILHFEDGNKKNTIKVILIKKNSKEAEEYPYIFAKNGVVEKKFPKKTTVGSVSSKEIGKWRKKYDKYHA